MLAGKERYTATQCKSTYTDCCHAASNHGEVVVLKTGVHVVPGVAGSNRGDASVRRQGDLIQLGEVDGDPTFNVGRVDKCSMPSAFYGEGAIRETR